MADITLTDEQWTETFNPLFTEDEGEFKIMACNINIEKAKEIAQKIDKENWENHIWTTIDGDDGNIYLVSGMHFVNNIDWYFTKTAFDPTDNIEVLWFEDSDNE